MRIAAGESEQRPVPAAENALERRTGMINAGT